MDPSKSSNLSIYECLLSPLSIFIYLVCFILLVYQILIKKFGEPSDKKTKVKNSNKYKPFMIKEKGKYGSIN